MLRQRVSQLELERQDFEEKLSKAYHDNDKLRENIDLLRNQCDDTLVSENTSLKEEVKELESKVGGYVKKIKELEEKSLPDDNRVYVGLHRIESDESIIRLKQSAKQKKKQVTTTDELSCEFDDCSANNVDLIKCNMCTKWVCGDCNEIPIAKVKPIFNKCRRLYFLCKTCDEKIGNQDGYKSGFETAMFSANTDFMSSLQKMLDKKVNQLEVKIDKSLDKKLGERFGEVKNLTEKIKDQVKKSTDEKETYAKILEVPKEVRQIIQETA